MSVKMDMTDDERESLVPLDVEAVARWLRHTYHAQTFIVVTPSDEADRNVQPKQLAAAFVSHFGVPAPSHLVEMAVDAYLGFIAQFVETEDGTFTFPDGYVLEGCSLRPAPDAEALRLAELFVNEANRIEHAGDHRDGSPTPDDFRKAASRLRGQKGAGT